MKLTIFSVVALATGMTMHPKFPSDEPTDRFWLTSAAQALTSAQAEGNMNGYGITEVTRILCNRMHTVRNAGGPGEVHIKHCNMHWVSNSWGHVNNCITSMDISACLMCRRAPTSDNFSTTCTQL